MKTIKLLLLCFVAVFLSSCYNDFQVNMKYYFFTKSELANISINQDSAMSLQNKVSKLKTYDEFILNFNGYDELDTVYFKDEKGDTVHLLNNSSINIQNTPSFFTRTYTKTVLGAFLTSIDNITFETISFSLTKESDVSIYKDIVVVRPNYDYQNLIYYRFRGANNKTNSDKCTLKYESYNWNNTEVDSCMIFTEFDTLMNETFKIVYSNIHGFLLIKDKQHEITRIL